MQELMAKVATAGVKRLVVLALGVAAVALNKKFGLELTTEQQGLIAAMVTGYILQSGYNSAKKAGADASAAVTTPETAVGALQNLVTDKGDVGELTKEDADKLIKDVLEKLAKPAAMFLVLLATVVNAQPLTPPMPSVDAYGHFINERRGMVAGGEVIPTPNIMVSDAPVATIHKEGDVLSESVVCMTPKTYVNVAKTIVALDAENEYLKKSNISWPVVVAVAVGTLVVGGLVGYGIGVAVNKPVP